MSEKEVNGNILEAETRIEAELKARTGALDLSGLGLEELPSSLFNLEHLASLDLSRNSIGPKDVSHLSNLTSLTSLGLRRNGIGPAEASHLSNLKSLASLALGGNELGLEGLSHLSNLTTLRSLELRDCGIDSRGMFYLSNLSSLTTLNLSHNVIGPEGLSHISRLSGLTRLNLSVSQIGDEGLVHLEKLAALARLELRVSRIGDRGALSISKISGLLELSLSANAIGERGAIALAQLPKIRYLSIMHNSIANEGFAALMKVQSLETCDLERNAITEVVDISNASSLKTLDLSKNEIERFNPTSIVNHRSLKIFSASKLGDVPQEILGINCLSELRHYHAALERGQPVELSDVKVMILGNGQIGKTQMRRHICGEEFDENIISTHGVDICEAQLENDKSKIDLKLWDFGGQDIYLGTHSLFLKSRAVFPLVWTPRSENNETHIVDGYESKNFPIGYWVDYVKKMAGDRAPILLVQSQCDLPEQAQSSPIERTKLDDFTFKPREIGFSAKTGTGRDALRGGLLEAVDYLKRQRGAIRIGEGWAKVKTEIERRQKVDRSVESGSRSNQLMTLREFTRLAQDVGQVSGKGEASVLLQYLHDIGTVFYQKGQFDEQIILDQQWALDSIYAVFHRENGLYKVIEENRGRFTQSQLDRWIWKDRFSRTEQTSLIGMMKSCDICFTIRTASKVHGEAIYVAPDLLPMAKDLFDERTKPWDEDVATLTARYKFDLLPPALIRYLMAQIGERVGQHAVYWKTGLYFVDGATDAKARIEVQLDDPKAWSGQLKIDTKEGQANVLFQQLVQLTEQFCRQVGIEPQGVEKPELHDADNEREQVSLETSRTREADASGSRSKSDDTPAPVLQVRPQLTLASEEECFISYAWGDDSDANCPRTKAFEQVRNQVQSLGMSPFFDKEKISNSEAISAFMDRATNRPKSVIILSKKYLQSPFCMFELTSLYRKAKSDEQRLREMTRVVVLDDVQILRDEDWLYWQDYWDGEVERYDNMMAGRPPRKIPKKTLDNSKYVSDFASLVGDILAAVADTVHYRGIDAIEDLSF